MNRMLLRQIFLSVQVTTLWVWFQYCKELQVTNTLIFSTHPSGEKRTLYIYDYIAKAYPEYIEQGFDTESYEEFLIYYEDVAKERAQNPEKMIKHEKKFEKLEEKRKKKYAKYQRKWIRQEEKQRQKELDKIKEEQAD